MASSAEHLTAPPVPEPESAPGVNPGIKYYGSAESAGLPFRLKVNPEALGTVMKDMGFSDSDIGSFTLTVAYGEPPLTQLTRRVLGKSVGRFAYMGSAHPLSGDVTLDVNRIERRAMQTYRSTLNALSGKAKPANGKSGLERAADFVLEQTLPGLYRPPAPTRKPDRELLASAGIIAREAGMADARTFLERETAKLLETSIRQALPHELTHAHQIHRGATFVNIATGIVALKVFDMAWDALWKSVNFKSHIGRAAYAPVRNKFFSFAGQEEHLKKRLLRATIGTVRAAGFFRTLNLMHQLVGYDRRAQESAIRLADQFRSVITLERTKIPFPGTNTK
ncbi:hypothetical protein A2Z33_03590 [Candidatus Gottesmanbacteria bacterium RBG_16_52_11]|uniref:Uncharacterized protein n=1 Tax=Candidatus Gottesmanbacteria bacterium RBG_16_52_11 TaxID=1798374 RepID=A0A1F5YVH2_9BACT|nr:MAG: hypothetical protein A2Z33_03590 [Candidatus Gottesmanbacteria bacterium RBG_16_52_11]